MEQIEILKERKEKKSFFPWFKKNIEIKISDYLDMNHIFYLNSFTWQSAVNSMIEGLYKFEFLSDYDSFKNAIFEREKIVSTGIGMGVAIPHAKISSFDKFFIAIGIQQKKGIEWNSIDKVPVRLIFMIGGPDDRQAEYLQILSNLTKVIKDESLRKQILSTRNGAEVLKLLSPF